MQIIKEQNKNISLNLQKISSLLLQNTSTLYYHISLVVAPARSGIAVETLRISDRKQCLVLWIGRRLVIVHTRLI